MLRLGNVEESLNVVCDQIYIDYARFSQNCLDILTLNSSSLISKKGNLYHYSNEGIASWYDFATLIMELAGLNCKINPILSKDYPTLAKRPMYSVLDKTKIKEDFKISIPDWKESLGNCINNLKR